MNDAIEKAVKPLIGKCKTPEEIRELRKNIKINIVKDKE